MRVCGASRDSAGAEGQGQKEAVRWISDHTADKKKWAAKDVHGPNYRGNRLENRVVAILHAGVGQLPCVPIPMGQKMEIIFGRKKYYVANRTFLLANITFFIHRNEQFCGIIIESGAGVTDL
ncbi:MAG: hypothetical protein L6V80_06065 [Bacteroidales bacterium]|nr:MAG: hypothetical protein L6V80_06065 [Bacteroidales bacterium]